MSGFTFIRNGIRLGYPFRQSIESLLPLVDELIVNVADSDDASLESVLAIHDAKLQVFTSDWDETLRSGGKILSLQTNRALRRCSGEWAFYLQADEVLHGDDYPAIRDAMVTNLPNESVDALSFRFVHFEGGFRYVNPLRYRRQVRIVRSSGEIQSVGDACGFGRTDGRRLRVRDSGGRIFHYGWSRPPRLMSAKNKALETLYHDDEYIERKYGAIDEHAYRDIEVCRPFKGSHPAVMRDLVDAAEPGPSPSRAPYLLRPRVWQWLAKKWGIIDLRR